MNDELKNHKCLDFRRKKTGLSLVEILVALMILALAVLPAIGSFSKYYGVASSQMEQEIALKLGEAVINIMLSTTYSDLVKGTLTNLPLNIQLPSGSFAGNLAFVDGNATGTPITIGRAKYIIGAEVKTIFRGQNLNAPHADAMEFTWQIPLPPGPPPVVASYSCFDDLLCIKVTVAYSGASPIELATFRADMTR